ncbi:hypothetical protein [Arsenophonus nasoniae]|uniref:hypothetical protein n=1 Tax=Arsenophonus nasoniae TaxID=638 RepID=UPI0038795EE1
MIFPLTGGKAEKIELSSILLTTELINSFSSVQLLTNSSSATLVTLFSTSPTFSTDITTDSVDNSVDCVNNLSFCTPSRT